MAANFAAKPEADAGPPEGIVLILPSFLAIMGGIVLVPVLPLMAQEYAGTPHLPFLLQAILTIPSLMVVLCSPIAGILGDRYGRKQLLLGAMLIYSLLGLSPLMLTSIYAVLASRVLLGVVEAAVLTLATTLLGDAFSGNARNRWFGYQIGGGALVAIPLLSASGYLGQFGWRISFLIYALPLIMFLFVLFIAKERTGSEGPKDGASAAAGFPWRHMSVVGAISLFASVSFFVLQMQQGLAMAEVGIVSTERIGNLAALASIGAPVGTVLFRFVAHRSANFRLCYGFSGAAAGLLGVAFAPDAGWTVAAIFIGLIGTNIVQPTMLSWAANGLSHAYRARGVGIWQGIFAVGQFVSAMIFGWSMAALGSAKMAFVLVGASVAIAALLSIALSIARAIRDNRLAALPDGAPRLRGCKRSSRGCQRANSNDDTAQSKAYMTEFNESNITNAVLESLARTPSPRTKQISEALVRHLHGFIRDVEPTEQEWAEGIAFLTQTGQMCSGGRQEFILLSDALGVSMLVDAINHRLPDDATATTVLGPFYVEPPAFACGDDISPGAEGFPLYISGTVRSIDGQPLGDAVVDIWHSDPEGFYDLQLLDQKPGLSGRGRFRTAADGSFHIWTIRPSPYPIPHDGPVGAMLAAQGRHAYRPEHVHFMIEKDGYRKVVTHLFAQGGDYLDSDVVFGVKESLIRAYEDHVGGSAPDGRVIDGPWYALHHDFVLLRT